MLCTYKANKRIIIKSEHFLRELKPRQSRGLDVDFMRLKHTKNLTTSWVILCVKYAY